MDLIKKVEKLKNWQVLTIFAAFIMVAYSNILSAPFIWDDRGFILANEFIKSFSYLPDWFTENFLKGMGIDGVNLYRPIQLMLHASIYSIFEFKEWAYHTSGIFIHIANTFLVFTLFKKLKFSHAISIVAGLLFAIHPVNVEAVSYISAVSATLTALFILGALNIFISNKPWTFQKHLGVMILTMLALFSKEIGLTTFILATTLTIYFWNQDSTNQRKAKIKSIFLMISVSILYMIMRFHALGSSELLGLNSATNIYTEDALVRIISFISILPEYIKLIFTPLDLYLEKPFPIYTNLFTLKGIIGVSMVILGLIGSYFSLKKQKIFFLGFFWFFISLGPVSGIVASNALYAERWLYIPIIGVLIILAGLFQSLKSKQSQKITLIATLIIAALFTTKTINRNQDWANPIQFFQNEILNNPSSARLYNQIGRLYLESGEYTEAASHLEKGVEKDEKKSIPLLRYRLGEAYLYSEKTPEAAKQYFATLEISPNMIQAHQRLEKIFRFSGYESKADEFKKLIQKIENNDRVTLEEIEPLKIQKQ